MAYMVSEDLLGANPIRIHKEGCGHIKRKSQAKTMRWHGPYDQEEAERVAEIFSGQYHKGWRNCEHCMTKP